MVCVANASVMHVQGDQIHDVSGSDPNMRELVMLDATWWRYLFRAEQDS